MNIYDIAEEAGVSISTVSRVLNNKSRVKKETREKVEEILKKHGYKPSQVARGLATKSTKTIGVMVVDMRVMHYANTTYVVEQELSRLGYTAIVCNTGGLEEENLRYLNLLHDQQVDGLVLVGSVFETLAELPEAVEILNKTPFVIANGEIGLEGACSVLVDDPAGARLAVQHLYEKGHRGIYYVQDMNTHSAKRKAAGFAEAMEALGLPGKERILKAEYGLDGGRKLGAEVAKNRKKKKITALVFGEDDTAIGAMNELLRAGVRVPEEVAVTGFNNSICTRMCSPALTSVDNRCRMVGEYCVKILSARIEHEETPASVLVRPVLDVKESS